MEFEIHFTGNNIAPGSVRSREIADIIKSVEDMIVSTVIKDQSMQETTEQAKIDDLILGLVSLSSGSLSLNFLPSSPEPMFIATQKVASAINANKFDDLAEDTKKALRKVISFLRKHSCSAELKAKYGEEQLFATLTTETVIDSTPPLSGETTIYGKIIRVGGEEKPKVLIEALNGENVSCDISMENAKELGRRLYSWIGLYGTASWNVQSLKIEGFRVERITNYRETSIKDAMVELSSMIGPYYSEVDDVVKYVNDLRSDSLED